MDRLYQWRWVAFAFLNAVLYANLLPLWEGFDEPFHYSFVESLSVRHQLPDAGGGQMARDVEASLALAPASLPVKHNLPQVMTYDEYFRVPEQQRASMRKQLEMLPAEWRREFRADGPPNYESQQSPLAYLLLAPFDALLGNQPLAVRVLWLRMLCGVAAALLQSLAALALARELELSERARSLMMLLVATPQMFYAAVAHVGNDWLAVSLSSWFIVAMVRFVKQPDPRRALWLGVITGAGLLTKAYFLAWAVAGFVAMVSLLWRRRLPWKAAASFTIPACAMAAPAAIRNIVVLGSLTGMQQSSGGIGLKKTFAAFVALNWWEALPSLLRSALWTGNSTYNSFSRSTLNVVLLLLAAGLAGWTFTRQRHRGPERWIAVALACFGTALLYFTALTFAHIPGELTLAPWYTAAAHVPLACLVSLGAESVGRWLGIALSAAFSYVLCATYVVKLIPMYGGCELGRMGWAALTDCYWSNAERTASLLRQTALGPQWVIALLTVLVLAMALWLAVGYTRIANVDSVRSTRL